MAEQILDEAERLAAETNQVSFLNRARQLRAGIAGMSGDEERHRDIVNEQATVYQLTHASHRMATLTLMRGNTAVMLGRADEALALLGGLFEPDDPIFDARTCYEAFYFLADAAKMKDRAEAVHRAVEVMEATVPAPWPPILQSASTMPGL